MFWDCNLHCLAVFTCRVPTCTSTLLHFPAPGCSSRYPKGGFCPLPDPPSAPGDASPFLLPWFGAALPGCGCIPSRGKGGTLWVLHPQPGVAGLGVGSTLCTSGVFRGAGWGSVPDAFEQEQNSRGSWMPLGVRLFSWSWAVAGAGALPSLWAGQAGEP